MERNQTIRELIAHESAELREIEKLGPHEAANKLVVLSSLLSSLGAEIATKRAEYTQIRLKCLKEAKSVAESRIYSEATNEFKEWQEREEQRKALIEIIHSIKYFLRTCENEMKL